MLRVFVLVIVIMIMICACAVEVFVNRADARVRALLHDSCAVVVSRHPRAGNKQHTFIETDSVRYVYQPIENLFLLLLTNKASNIVEDLETLRMLSKGMLAALATGTGEGLRTRRRRGCVVWGKAWSLY